MSLNAQVSAERVHIGFFGLRNAGKSSLVNRVTGQELSVGDGAAPPRSGRYHRHAGTG